jgi:2-polyprenyl-3-methyl-5-hydroxy-6-metoxy-1,4-benzoquinol methylase
VENNIARLHQEAGRLDEALKHLRRAAAGRPGDEAITGTLVSVLLDTGRPEEARSILDAAPPTVARLRQLAHIHERAGRRPEAERALRRAIALAPDEPETWQQAATLWLRTGERARAMPYARRGARLEPGSARAWALFGQSLNGLSPVGAAGAGCDAFAADLLEALHQPATENAHLLHAIVGVLGRNPALARLGAAAAGPDPDAAVAALLQDVTVHALPRDRLLRALLETTVVSDRGLERALTVLRRVLLGLAEHEGLSVLDHPDWLPFLCALAGQCFLNEYAYFETPEETAAVARLNAAMLAVAERQEAPVPVHVALYAAYRPLARWPMVADLVAYRSWPEPVVTLLLRQAREPVTEEMLAKALERLTPIRDTVSQAVRAQYEENPYPRWRHAGLLDAPRPVPEVLRAILPHVRLDSGPWWEAPRVLVAGCGTGREPVWAANHMAGARVLAVDLSLASLSYATRQSRTLGLDAITYAQADLLELGRLDRRFDIIQCVGVLHHMADPLAGWRVLAGLLEPHGVMKVGLYSAHARAAVRAARAFIAERGYAGTPADIRRLRQDLLEMPAEHPAARTLAPIVWSPDFYNVSTCRDLLFHVQEHQTTLPEVASWLTELGLEFLGFQHEDPAIAHHYRDRFPEDPDMVSLDLWDRFEMDNPDTFAGLYQFWVRPHRKAAP